MFGKEKKVSKAHLKCMKCAHDFHTAPGPTTCPACGHGKLEWIDYEGWAKKNKLNGYENPVDNTKSAIDDKLRKELDRMRQEFVDQAKNEERKQEEIRYVTNVTMDDNIILLDLDGVMTQFSEGVAKLFNIPTEVMIENWPGGWFAIEEAIGISTDEMWEMIKAEGERFWANLEETPWARELYEKCQELAPVFFLTAPSRDPYSLAGKMQWIYKFTGDNGFGNCMLGRPKFLCANTRTILIDDADHNVNAFRASGGRSILLPLYVNSANEEWEKLGDESYLKVLDELREMIEQEK
jgi:5'(3')-deoxyribonucleotidase/ribosomal protein L37E